MKDQLLLKFQELVEICLESGNHSKISATTLVLLNNIITSHALSLHISTKPDAFIYERMLQINHVMSFKMGYFLYKEEMINQIKLIERLMEKGKGEIPKKFIKKAIRLYFQIQEVSIPQLESNFENEAKKTFNKGIFHFNKSREESPIQKLINYELSSRERTVRAQMDRGKKNEAILELQKIASLKASIMANNRKKMKLTTNLSDEQRYFWFQSQSKVYPLLGVFLLLTTFSLLILMQLVANLELLASLGTFFLLFSGSGIFSLYLYIKIKQKVVIN